MKQAQVLIDRDFATLNLSILIQTRIRFICLIRDSDNNYEHSSINYIMIHLTKQNEQEGLRRISYTYRHSEMV